MKIKIAVLIITLTLLIGCFTWLSFGESPILTDLKGEVSYLDSSNDIEVLMESATSFIVVKHAPLGGSHYAYTEALAEENTGFSPEGTESNFYPGSSMLLMTLEKEGEKIKQTTYELLDSPKGCIRDPDVSEDGKRVIFSWKKKAQDDFHLYEMEISTQEVKQLTFGSGVADIEPQYCANGDIIFSSSRAIQTVDCWKTPVSNLYKCSSDGSNIIRLGYDQVHTTYPTTLSDGRIIYTRWDYNDRSQMFVQGVFQMNPDGTNQTELFGNNSNFPTTLLHTREISGVVDKFVSIATGHHTYQAGKLVILDLSDGRNSSKAVSFVYPDSSSVKDPNIDAFGQTGALYQYPYAVNENLFLVSYCKSGWSSVKSKTPFGIYLMNAQGKKTELLSGKDGACANIIPIKERTLFERPSMVNYAMDTGTYYVADVYKGEGMKNVKRGSVKNIRVVALDYREYAIGATIASGNGSADPFTPIATGNGAWDIKVVLGLATVYEDGSAMFSVPSEVPVYFQLLDENGSVIQTMRSWSTLMPNEIYSCVGCHEDNNTAPTASIGTTIALKKGVESLKGDVWQGEDYDPYKSSIGFSYLEEIQPIFDSKCISCHNNKNLAYSQIDAGSMNNSGADISVSGTTKDIFSLQSDWQYLISSSNNAPVGWNGIGYDASAWKVGKAGFGDRGGDGAKVGTPWSDSSNYIFLRKTFNISDVSEFEGASMILNTWYDDDVKIYLNGTLVFSDSGWTDAYTTRNLGPTFSDELVSGENVLAISINQHVGGRFIDAALSFIIPDGNDLEASSPISLEGVNLYSSRMKKYFPLSYLVLTGSTPRSGVQWVGNSNNKYVNWLSSMSSPDVPTAGTYGSLKSSLISKLRSGHGNLSDNEIKTISAWIDLGVPCYGSYDENNAWNDNDKREAEEEQNKRDYYDMLDRYAKMALSDTLPDGEINLSFKSGTTVKEVSGSGIVSLNVGKYSSKDEITVKLSDGCKYIGLTLCSRMGESIIYCSDGMFTFKFDSAYMKKLYPGVVTGINMTLYSENIITVRIPTKEDLAEKRNIAENIYDIRNSENSYPHASSDSEYENFKGDVDFLARNAIDGFTSNKGHGSYPVQSWGPANSNNHYIKIDFGREVTVEEIGVIIRYDIPHDTYFKTGVLELSDGTNISFKLKCVGDEQIIELEKPIKTSYVKLKKLVAEKTGGWAALTEVKVYGYDND